MNRIPRIEIIVVGDELLSGRVVDTNSAFLGRELAAIGLPPVRVVRVGDDETAIREALADATGRSDLALAVGGLGPTADDRTLAAAADLAGLPLVVHLPTLRRIMESFRAQRKPMPRLAARQALVPKGARLIRNPVGMVPGIIIVKGPNTVVLLPGVPAELRAIWESALRRFVSTGFRGRPCHSLTIRTFGIAESAIAERVASTLRRHTAVQVGFYPSTRGVDLLLSSAERSRAVRCSRALGRLLGKYVYEAGEAPLEEVVGRLLRKQKLTLAVAESCTGGLISDRLTDVPGSSDYLLGGVISYSNQVKVAVLGLHEQTLRDHGAVSRETVSEMACRVRGLFNAKVGIAVSGVAGPSGGTKTRPVGLVHMAVNAGRRLAVEYHRFGGDRRLVKERSASAALDLCRRVLEKRT